MVPREVGYCRRELRSDRLIWRLKLSLQESADRVARSSFSKSRSFTRPESTFKLSKLSRLMGKTGKKKSCNVPTCNHKSDRCTIKTRAINKEGKPWKEGLVAAYPNVTLGNKYISICMCHFSPSDTVFRPTIIESALPNFEQASPVTVSIQTPNGNYRLDSVSLLMKQLRETQQELATLKEESTAMKQMLSKFNRDEIEKMQGRKVNKWTTETLLKALNIRLSMSTQAYNNLLKQGYPLPGLSTVEDFLRTTTSANPEAPSVSFEELIEVRPEDLVSLSPSLDASAQQV